jgi:acetyl-CoA carboxylase biotin carboxyl carrier protein
LTCQIAVANDAPFDRKPTLTLDLKDIKDLIALMRKNDLSVFKMEKEGFKITLKRGNDYQPLMATTPVAQSVALPLPAAAPSPAPGAAQDGAGPEKLREITSPMVGTFYSSPSPEAPAYVSVGQEVTEDTVVCIIEAMKVMNEIKAECRGTVVEVAAESGKPVQFGQTLFRLR